MDVIIVGSGIAGLTASIALRRAGHRVRIFESTHTSTAFGAGVVLGHNASTVMSSYGLNYNTTNMSVGGNMKLFKGDSLDHISTFPMNSPAYEKRPGTKQYYAHRVDLQNALVRLATQPDGEGTPVQITYNATVVLYDAENGGITLADCSTFTADLVIAADGVHSKSPRAILGYDFDATYTGTTIVRFMLPTSVICDDPLTAKLVGEEGQSSFYIGPERRRYILQYPVRGDTEQNFGLYTIEDNAEEIDAQMLRFKSDQESLRKELDGFHPSVLALVPKTSQILPVWKLVERTPMPTWYRGRLVAIGDAVHPMLPNQGQGAGMVVEDCGALGVMLSKMKDTSAQSITERLALFEKIRKPRASVVQLLSSVPYFENGMKIMWPKLIEHMPPEELPGFGGAADVRPWLFRYDVLEASQGVLDEYLERQKPAVNGRVHDLT